MMQNQLQQKQIKNEEMQRALEHLNNLIQQEARESKQNIFSKTNPQNKWKTIQISNINKNNNNNNLNNNNNNNNYGISYLQETSNNYSYSEASCLTSQLRANQASEVATNKDIQDIEGSQTMQTLNRSETEYLEEIKKMVFDHMNQNTKTKEKFSSNRQEQKMDQYNSATLPIQNEQQHQHKYKSFLFKEENKYHSSKSPTRRDQSPAWNSCDNSKVQETNNRLISASSFISQQTHLINSNNSNSFNCNQEYSSNKGNLPVSERLYADGFLREGRIKQMQEQQKQEEQQRKLQQDKNRGLSQESKRIVQNKIARGLWPSMHERWDTLLQIKAEKILSEKLRKEREEQQEYMSLQNRKAYDNNNNNYHSNKSSNNDQPKREDLVEWLNRWDSQRKDKLEKERIKQEIQKFGQFTFSPSISPSKNFKEEKDIPAKVDEDVTQRMEKIQNQQNNKLQKFKTELFLDTHPFTPQLMDSSLNWKSKKWTLPKTEFGSILRSTRSQTPTVSRSQNRSPNQRNHFHTPSPVGHENLILKQIDKIGGQKRESVNWVWIVSPKKRSISPSKEKREGSSIKKENEEQILLKNGRSNIEQNIVIKYNQTKTAKQIKEKEELKNTKIQIGEMENQIQGNEFAQQSNVNLIAHFSTEKTLRQKGLQVSHKNQEQSAIRSNQIPKSPTHQTEFDEKLQCLINLLPATQFYKKKVC